MDKKCRKSLTKSFFYVEKLCHGQIPRNIYRNTTPAEVYRKPFQALLDARTLKVHQTTKLHINFIVVGT